MAFIRFDCLSFCCISLLFVAFYRFLAYFALWCVLCDFWFCWYISNIINHEEKASNAASIIHFTKIWQYLWSSVNNKSLFFISFFFCGLVVIFPGQKQQNQQETPMKSIIFYRLADLWLIVSRIRQGKPESKTIILSASMADDNLSTPLR